MSSRKAPTGRSGARARKKSPPETGPAVGPLGFYGYTAGDVMSSPSLNVRPDDTLRSAAAIMSRRSVSGLPVVDGKRGLVGVLSQKDVVRVLHDEAGLALPAGLFDLLLDAGEARRSDLLPSCRAVLGRTKVRRAMSAPAIAIDASATIEEAVRLMLEHKVNRLPVLRRGKVAGIVTRHDLLTRIGESAATA